MNRFLSLIILCIVAAGIFVFLQRKPFSPSQETVDLSGSGWSLWRDNNASWENDELFLPPVDISKIPINIPSGGWEKLASKDSVPVAVPGTAEEYLGKGLGPESMVKGVTWWVRTFEVPRSAKNKTIRLLFDSVRLRAEVYVNQKLVAYDIVGNTPFEADLTGVVKPGEKVQLAVRVTNPGGNFDWRDKAPFKWGRYTIPMSHGFSGITGRVRLSVTDPVYIDDLYIQNTPAKTVVNVIATVKNTTGSRVNGSAEVAIHEKGSDREVFRKKLAALELKAGETTLTCPVSLPDAKLWDLESPNLYETVVTCKTEAGLEDSATRSFGFRWFAPEGIGSNALLRLNGKRIVLRTAISWGFWPINGIFPSPELAAKQVQTAKEFGINMLNFHRCIGNPIVFDKADEMGLLYFEEPGGYASAQKDPFAQAISREKLFRMIKRDRSHPSLIIYNMINEVGDEFKDPEIFAVHRQDIKDAHARDPSRVIVYTSAWAGRAPDPRNDPAKMNMQPFDPVIHMFGWWDFHRAGGPELWKQSFYRGPDNHYGRTENTKEIVYWGEEGAISSPPRLGLIKKSLDGAVNLGWDGQVYLDWYKAFDDYLNTNKLRGAFPTVDALCVALGAVSIEHQGRKIEDTRICDANDGYAINGWESELIENHSGVVDCFRNPKADPSILAYYNQALYVAVKPRSQISPFPGSVKVDFYVVNEKDLHGLLTLKIHTIDQAGRETFSKDLPVRITGGDIYAQLLSEAVDIPLTSVEGISTITASLVDSKGNDKAIGHDQVMAVDWKKIPISGTGAVFETGTRIHDFLKFSKNIEAPAFDDSQGKLDWLIVAKSPFNEPVLIPKESFLQPDGKSQGLQTSFYAGEDFSKALHRRLDDNINLKVDGGASPDSHLPLTENYSVRWEGKLIPTVSGDYTIKLLMNKYDNARFWIDGKQLFNDSNDAGKHTAEFKVTLEAGRAVPIRVELIEKKYGARMQMLWQTPTPEKTTAAQVLERARRDGTTLLILDRGENWLEPIGKTTGIPQGKSFEVGLTWLGGQYFVKDHPLFAGLPVNQALNWPYQGVVCGSRLAFEINGGELVAGAYHTWPMQLGSAVSILPVGRGKIIISSLDITDQLDNPDSAAEVARKLFCNFLNFAGPIK